MFPTATLAEIINHSKWDFVFALIAYTEMLHLSDKLNNLINEI